MLRITQPRQCLDFSENTRLDFFSPIDIQLQRALRRKKKQFKLFDVYVGQVFFYISVFPISFLFVTFGIIATFSSLRFCISELSIFLFMFPYRIEYFRMLRCVSFYLASRIHFEDVQMHSNQYFFCTHRKRSIIKHLTYSKVTIISLDFFFLTKILKKFIS